MLKLEIIHVFYRTSLWTSSVYLIQAITRDDDVINLNRRMSCLNAEVFWCGWIMDDTLAVVQRI